MKLKELIKVVYDVVIIYKQGDEVEEYENIFKGNTFEIPSNILDMEVGSVGVNKSAVLDIEVR